MKKALSLLTCAALLTGLFAVMAPASFAAETVNVGSAAELQETVKKINAGELSADTNITLTANIDLTGYSDVSKWEPIYRYSGTFDGAGHTISGLDWTFKMQNGGGNMPDANVSGSYIINEYNAQTDEGGRGADAALAMLFVKTENAVLKNFTVKDSTLNLVCTYNKNYQLYVGGLVGWMDGGSISDVKLENVDIPGFGDACVNQKYLGFAGLIAGNALNGVTLENVNLDSECLIDSSANIKLDVAAMIGRYTSGAAITFKSCSTAATVKAAEDVSDTSGLMWNKEGVMVGGYAAAFVARFNDNNEEGTSDLFYDCSNTGALSGAKENANENGFVGDVNTRTNITYQEKTVEPDPGEGEGGQGGQGGEGGEGGEPTPPATGSAAIVLASVAVLALAGVCVATGKREQD